MIKKYLYKLIIPASLIGLLFVANTNLTFAQVSGPQVHDYRWMNVGSIHHWFSNGGAEIEYGRRGRAGFQNVDQLDGLNWPGEFTTNKGVHVGNSLWIGTTNFLDPVSGQNYGYKVVCAGRLNMNLGIEVISDGIKMIGKFDHPTVLVDDAKASVLDYDDLIDEIDPNLVADRVVENTIHTQIGITVKRRIYQFTNQYNDNYYIYENVFKNTGIIDRSGQPKLNKPLTDVVIHWQHRYGFSGESYLPVGAWSPTGASWGLNTINDNIGDPFHPGEFRAFWSYYGPVSTSPGISEDIGLPRHTNGSILAGTCFAGVVVLHADKSASDHSDDPSQPFTTQFMPSDRGAQGDDPYDISLMARKYAEFMTAGHPAQTHAEQVGKDANGWPTNFANTWGGDAGGYAGAQAFGPYDLAIGDSVRIVYAEAVAGIMSNRDHVREIANKWFNNSGPFDLPDGSTTNDRNIYKNTWVFTGKDSLFQSFRRAIANFRSDYSVPTPPPPPSEFKVNSGGNKIALSWSNSAESWPNFNGYRIYRAEGRYDSTFNMIFSCDKGNVVNSFNDVTAKRGFNYYYYIQTKDDGSTNNIEPGVPLVSSKFYTMTNTEARLTRPPGNNLAGIRIVPNPYNIKAKSIQFGFDTPDKLAFYGLPPACKIRIFTETGDLVETIDHNDGSGDQLWHSITSSRQLVVSGLYIAHIEVTQDYYDEETGELLFKTGDSTFKKFIIIR